MPHMKKALQTFFKTYPAFISHLHNESHSNPKAEGLAKMLEDCTLMTYAAFLQEILSSLVQQSLTLQQFNITLADAKVTISSTMEILQQFSTSSCILMHDIETRKEISGYPLKRQGPPTDMEKKVSVIKSSLIKHTEARYRDLGNDVKESTIIANVKSWP
ncbi:uncharacterized protein LOC134279702 [Saccostrea cucullata]|uniref:uncharacterized protein LOC134279702 n=1 Tax=Saccostrea cuccullata TaxID=36930 RepID=UPI002ECFBA46